MKDNKKNTPLDRAIARGAMSSDQTKDLFIGKVGTKKRDEYELEFTKELLIEKIKEMEGSPVEIASQLRKLAYDMEQDYFAETLKDEE